MPRGAPQGNLRRSRRPRENACKCIEAACFGDGMFQTSTTLTVVFKPAATLGVGYHAELPVLQGRGLGLYDTALL